MDYTKNNFGVIDIGSNTVRGVVYRGLTANKESIAFKSGILEETKNGLLTETGVKNLTESIEKTLEYFLENQCTRTFAFATSAMRDVENFPELKNRIKNTTGVEIELISGALEAEYDYLALKSISGNPSGVGIDLGGGSAQIVSFNEGGVLEAESFPIGVKRIKHEFSRSTIPTPDELDKINQHIFRTLSAITARSKTVWFMGGTAKAVSAASGSLFKKSILTPALLDELFAILSEDTALLKSIFPKRYDTIPVGIAVMKAIAVYLGAETLQVTDVGVRDGYIAAKFNTEGEVK